MLTDEQKQSVRLWAQGGDSLSEIHKKIAEELGVTMTYFDARLLVAELEVSLNPPEEEADEATVEEAPEPETASEDGEIRVTVDTVALPHAMVSGKATFSDGKRAAWYVDQMGRLGLDPEDEDFHPSQEDVVAFQTKLQQVLKSQGF